MNYSLSYSYGLWGSIATFTGTGSSLLSFESTARDRWPVIAITSHSCSHPGNCKVTRKFGSFPLKYPFHFFVDNGYLQPLAFHYPSLSWSYRTALWPEWTVLERFLRGSIDKVICTLQYTINKQKPLHFKTTILHFFLPSLYSLPPSSLITSCTWSIALLIHA